MQKQPLFERSLNRSSKMDVVACGEDVRAGVILHIVLLFPLVRSLV